MFTLGLFLWLIAFVVYSYGFIDLNLHLTSSASFLRFQSPLSYMVFNQMNVAGLLYVLLLGGLYVFYISAMKVKEGSLKNFLRLKLGVFFAAIVVILLCSFPAFTYDIFNYMTTAQVTYTHKENPYVVMPIEIPNEPGLAYTRAANKVALYGPVWLLLTWIPYALGAGHVWLTIIMFKLLVAAFYVVMLYFIYRYTKSMKQVLFFGLNPLVLIEVLISGHNDIVMMVLVFFALGIGVPAAKNMWVRIIAWVASMAVKGATVVLFPLVLKPKMEAGTMHRIAYWLMFAVFVLVAPVREELYPWYAVWFLPFAALLPLSKRSFIHGFSIALCIGLSMRHLPYILTREYGGSGPLLRALSTLIPTSAYILWYLRTYGLRALIASAFYGKNTP